MTVSFGITLASAGPLADASLAAHLGACAESLGFTELWTTDHVVIPSEISSRYPYSDDGRLPSDGPTASPDPLVWMAYVAARTTRIRLGTCVLVLPQREPLLLAKQVATLDSMSSGRIDLGVGVGWLREEFDAIGVPFERRGARADEQIAAMRVLWSGLPVSFEGEHVSFQPCVALPTPAQPDGVPVVVGGDSVAAARRAGRLGDGWFPGKLTVSEIAHRLDVMRDAAHDAGRCPESIRLLTAAPRDDSELSALIEHGFSHFTVGIAPGSVRTPDDVERRLTRLAERLGLNGAATSNSPSANT